MQLWRDTWNLEALTRRKRYYRELLRAGKGQLERDTLEEIEEYYALPAVA